METVSVSKGVFVFKNGFKPEAKKSRKKSKVIKESTFFRDELWYQSYKTLWNYLEEKLQVLNTEMFSNVLSNLITFMKESYCKEVTELPAATLLTGINMPDHEAQFSALQQEIKKHISPHVAILQSQDCNNLKSLVENMMMQLINAESYDSSDEDLEMDEVSLSKLKSLKLKKNQCTFAMLQSWYEEFQYEKFNKKVIAIIIPDFESFKAIVLQDFIQIASTYLNIIPFVLIFGVATSLTALNKALPYHVSSRVNIQVFNSQPSSKYLNQVLEEIIFTDSCSFHLSGRLFALFLDIFLFYDFSVTGFIQNFKYAMLEHFSGGNQFALCTTTENISKILKKFTHDDYESVRRHCLSFRKLVEDETPANQLKLLDDDKYFGKVLQEKLHDFHCYLNKLHTLLRCLQILVEDLPKSPLGKQIRELYILVMNGSISKLPEFREAFKLLGFQSKDEMTTKMNRMLEVIIAEMKRTGDTFYENLAGSVLLYVEAMASATNESEIVEMDVEDIDKQSSKSISGRKAMRDQLLERSKTQKKVTTMNKYEEARLKLVTYLENIFIDHLKSPNDFTFYEIYFFNDIAIQSNVIGSHRSAIHTALNNPNSYLQCNCCKLQHEASILDTMPDICIAYKLHQEYGKMINLYDWLQAFLAILDPINANDEDDDKRNVNPELQARFTQCVAELEYLGFVKSSKSKADHVARLTWGG